MNIANGDFITTQSAFRHSTIQKMSFRYGRLVFSGNTIYSKIQGSYDISVLDEEKDKDKVF